MPLPHSPHSPFSLRRLDATGYCDRCSFLYKLADLTFQTEWAGDSLVKYGIRVCPRCLDEPQQQFRVIHLSAEPKPLRDPRPGTLPRQPPAVLQFVLDDDEAGQLDTDALAPGGGDPVFGVYGTSVYDGGGKYG